MNQVSFLSVELSTAPDVKGAEINHEFGADVKEHEFSQIFQRQIKTETNGNQAHAKRNAAEQEQTSVTEKQYLSATKSDTQKSLGGSDLPANNTEKSNVEAANVEKSNADSELLNEASSASSLNKSDNKNDELKAITDNDQNEQGVEQSSAFLALLSASDKLLKANAVNEISANNELVKVTDNTTYNTTESSTDSALDANAELKMSGLSYLIQQALKSETDPLKKSVNELINGENGDSSAVDKIRINTSLNKDMVVGEELLASDDLSENFVVAKLLQSQSTEQNLKQIKQAANGLATDTEKSVMTLSPNVVQLDASTELSAENIKLDASGDIVGNGAANKVSEEALSKELEKTIATSNKLVINDVATKQTDAALNKDNKELIAKQMLHQETVAASDAEANVAASEAALLAIANEQANQNSLSAVEVKSATAGVNGATVNSNSVSVLDGATNNAASVVVNQEQANIEKNQLELSNELAAQADDQSSSKDAVTTQAASLINTKTDITKGKTSNSSDSVSPLTVDEKGNTAELVNKTLNVTKAEQESLTNEKNSVIEQANKSLVNEPLIGQMNSQSANKSTHDGLHGASQFEIQSTQNAKQLADNQQQVKTNQVQLAEVINIQHKDFVDSMKNKVMLMISQKLQQIDIKLDPPELGNVQVRVNLQNDVATVNFTVQNSQAKDALEQHMNKLRDMLNQSGVDVGEANVRQQEKNNNGQGEFNEQPSSNAQQASTEQKIAEESHITSTLVKASSVGIDFYA